MSRPELPDVAVSGDRLAALEALRQVLAEQIAACGSARDLSALAKQFRDTLAEIDGLGGTAAPTQEERTLDELAGRRSSRSADAAVISRARRRKPS